MSRSLFAIIAAVTLPVAALASAPDLPVLDEMVVTSTREAKAKKTLPESVSVADKEEIENVAPSHLDLLVYTQSLQSVQVLFI